MNKWYKLLAILSSLHLLFQSFCLFVNIFDSTLMLIYEPYENNLTILSYLYYWHENMYIKKLQYTALFIIPNCYSVYGGLNNGRE